MGVFSKPSLASGGASPAERLEQGGGTGATRRPFVSLRPELSIISVDEGEVRTEKPKTLVVLLLLVGAAAVLSFLGSYALSDVLVQADIVGKWTAGNDPRPRWMLTSFVVLLGGFTLIGMLARQASNSQLRRIDAIAD